MNNSQHLLLKALRGETVSRPPVWLMRQAGRYMPSYMKLRAKYDFFTRVQTPELACEITLQPINEIGPDAAIMFSDILVVPQAMGLEVNMLEGKGPFLPTVIQNLADVQNLIEHEAPEVLSYVYDAIKLIKQELNGKVPLIGFAGAPFTILCYMVEGKGSKTFDKAREFCVTQPEVAHLLLQKITNVTIAYLKKQVQAGVDCIQVFDSWSGLLGPSDFNAFALPYLLQISNELSPKVPVILYPKGSWYALSELGLSSASAIGIDWTLSPQVARDLTINAITLQGNFDPVHLLKPVAEIRTEVHDMIRAFGVNRYIANLGHGVLPHIPVDHVKAFVHAVKEFEL